MCIQVHILGAIKKICTKNQDWLLYEYKENFYYYII